MYRWYVFKWFNNKVVETTILNTLFMLLVLDSQGPTVQWTVVMRLIVHEGADVTNYQPAAGTASLTLPKANIILIFIQFCSSSPCVAGRGWDSHFIVLQSKGQFCMRRLPCRQLVGLWDNDPQITNLRFCLWSGNMLESSGSSCRTLMALKFGGWVSLRKLF